MPLRRTFAAAFLAAALLGATAPPLRAQCAMCRTALTQSVEGRNMSRSFNQGILVMMAAPYAVIVLVGTALFRDPIRRWARRRLSR